MSDEKPKNQEIDFNALRAKHIAPPVARPASRTTRFNFWWPTSDANRGWMILVLFLIGGYLFTVAAGKERLTWQSGIGDILIVFFFSSVIPVVMWYFIINTGRFVLHSSKRRIDTKPERDERQREVEELESSRRRVEITRLKKELGEDE